ncbi:unnamed protein product, partial [Heterosigma akashiwo]
HLFFIPKGKLIFCGIPKVGMTEWVKFFRHVVGAKDYLSLPHFKKDRENFLMSRLDISTATQLFDDPTWTKAVFFRNPLDRLLSAYMDKIAGMAFTQTVFNISTNDETEKNRRPVLTFSEFVDKLTDQSTLEDCDDPKGLTACTDPHWRPQMLTCGLDHLLPKYDFIGNFDHISAHTQMLLEKVGLWEKYGATFDDGKNTIIPLKPGQHQCWVAAPFRLPNETIWGFNQRGPSGAGNNLHATGSHNKLAESYTPELIEKVRKAYALDFAVWDEISAKE